MFVVYSEFHAEEMVSYPTIEAAREEVAKQVKGQGCAFVAYELVESHREQPAPSDVHFRIAKAYNGWEITAVMPMTENVYQPFYAFADGGNFKVYNRVMRNVPEDAVKRFRRLAYCYGWVLEYAR